MNRKQNHSDPHYRDRGFPYYVKKQTCMWEEIPGGCCRDQYNTTEMYNDDKNSKSSNKCLYIHKHEEGYDKYKKLNENKNNKIIKQNIDFKIRNENNNQLNHIRELDKLFLIISNIININSDKEINEYVLYKQKELNELLNV